MAGLARRRTRRLAVRVRTVDGTVRNVAVTVRGRRGRLEGHTRPRTFAGSRRLLVPLRRSLPAGRYTIVASGRRTDGSPVRAVRRVVRPAARPRR